jgi:hypothetical protein
MGSSKRAGSLQVHPDSKHFFFSSVAQAGLELVILLPHPLHLVDDRCVPPRLAPSMFVHKPAPSLGWPGPGTSGNRHSRRAKKTPEPFQKRSPG